VCLFKYVFFCNLQKKNKHVYLPHFYIYHVYLQQVYLPSIVPRINTPLHRLIDTITICHSHFRFCFLFWCRSMTQRNYNPLNFRCFSFTDVALNLDNIDLNHLKCCPRTVIPILSLTVMVGNMGIPSLLKWCFFQDMILLYQIVNMVLPG